MSIVPFASSSSFFCTGRRENCLPYRKDEESWVLGRIDTSAPSKVEKPDNHES